MEREMLVRLVTAAQGGDNGAMDALFNAFYDDVYYFALKTVKDQELACDITQETFVAILGTIGSLKEPAAFVTWMKQVAFSQCTRYFRKKKEVLVDEGEEGETVFDILAEDRAEFIPDEAVDQEDFRSTILAMLDQLSEEQRSAVMLYYYDELSVRQIAQIQGVSEGTVKSRLNYARKAIRRSVEDYEKKNDVRLHSVALLPLLYWLFAGARESMPAAAVEKAAGAMAAAGGTSVGAGSAASAGVAGAAAGKAVGIGLAVKVVAGIAAVALVVGGVGMGIASRQKDSGEKKEQTTQTSGVDSDAGEPDGQVPEGMQKVSCEGLYLYVDEGYDIQTPITEDGVECLADDVLMVSIFTRAMGPSGFRVDSSEALAQSNFTDEAHETLGQENGVSYLFREVDGYGYAMGCYVTGDRYWQVFVYTGVGDRAEMIRLATSAHVPEIGDYDKGQQGADLVPAGCRYVTADGVELAAGEPMPQLQAGDELITEVYTYKYEYVCSESRGMFHMFTDGWGLRVDDRSRETYPGLYPAINGAPLRNMDYAFDQCEAMIQAPQIPDTVEDMGYCFAHCTSLEKAPRIPAGVTDVTRAFTDCSSLVEAPVLPAGITDMAGTFAFCRSLRSVPPLPDSVTTMDQTFYGCKSLMEAPQIPEGVTHLHETFKDCTALVTAPQIPKGARNVGGMFSGCTALEYAPEIPEGIRSIGWLFEDCSSLRTAPQIPEGVEMMLATFSGCKMLGAAPVLPSTVTDIGHCFKGCESLEYPPVLPDGLRQMSYAFFDCKALKERPRIPDSVENQYAAFWGCDQLPEE